MIFLHSPDGEVQRLEEIRNVVVENDDLTSFVIAVPVFVAFDDIQKYVAHSVFFDVEKIESSFRLCICANRIKLATDTHCPLPLIVVV